MRRLESAHSPNSSAITKTPRGDDLNLGAKQALEVSAFAQSHGAKAVVCSDSK